MDNITLLSVNATFGLALFLFVAMANRSVTMALVRVNPSPPEGKVPVWFYQPWDILGIVLLAGFFYLQAVGSALMVESDKPIKINVISVAVSIGFQFMLAGVGLAIVLRRVGLVQWLGLRWKDWPLLILIAPVTVVCMWVIRFALILVGYDDLMIELGVEQVQASVAVFQNEKNLVVLILMGIAAAVVAPICEEVIFRGFLYPAMKRFVGSWMSALCSALMFSAAHGSVSALVPLFVFGLVLVALYEFTGSIWAPMAAHFLFNAASLVFLMIVRLFNLTLPT